MTAKVPSEDAQKTPARPAVKPPQTGVFSRRALILNHPLYLLLADRFPEFAGYNGEFAPSQLADALGTSRQNILFCINRGALTQALAWLLVSTFADRLKPSDLAPHTKKDAHKRVEERNKKARKAAASKASSDF